jgi:hypothetical protein
MSAIKLNSSGGGSITISPASTASTLTLTAPAQTGTIGLDGPAFKVYQTSITQTLSNNADTKVILNTEVFDTANCFDSTTNYRFTPNVAGYYMLAQTVVTAAVNSGGTLEILARIRKNGSTDLTWSTNLVPSTQHFNAITSSTVTYMNGTTDYVELYIYQNTNASLNVVGGIEGYTSFSGALVRAA